MKVYCVFADNLYDKELLYIFREEMSARDAQEVEQENYKASGSYANIIIEEWEVE